MRAAASAFRHHGGQVQAAARLYGIAPDQWLDLSTGISPWSWPMSPLSEDKWTRLPESPAALEAAAAECFGMDDASTVIAVPGSDMAIRLLASILPRGFGAQPTLVAPIFSGHVQAWPDAAVIAPDILTMTIAGAGPIVCANPNNPDGRLIDQALLRRHGRRMIVDEAFADTDPASSLLPDRGGVTILRSFGKFFGLAGIRLGFVIADSDIAQALRALLGDWPVSGPAVAIGTAAYRDSAWQAEQRPRLRQAAARLDAVLRKAGLVVVGGTSLFRLAAHDRAADLFAHLARHGILTRPFTDRPDWLRFGLPATPAQQDRLAATLNQWRDMA